MSYNAEFPEEFDILPAWAPQDANGASGLNGFWVDISNMQSLTFIMDDGVGTLGNDPAITLQQADSATGGNAKALNVSHYYLKKPAGAATALTRGFAFEKVTLSTAGNSVVQDDWSEKHVLVAVHIKPIDLDVTNGFHFVRASVSDPNAAEVIAGLYIGERVRGGTQDQAIHSL